MYIDACILSISGGNKVLSTRSPDLKAEKKSKLCYLISVYSRACYRNSLASVFTSEKGGGSRIYLDMAKKVKSILIRNAKVSHRATQEWWVISGMQNPHSSFVITYSFPILDTAKKI